MEDEEAVRVHVKVPLLPFIDKVVIEEVAGVVQFTPLEPVENPTAKQTVLQEVGIPVPPVKEDIAGVVQFAPLEPVENRAVEQIVDVPDPQFHEDNVEVILALQEFRVCFCCV